jgi:hypothetical protein
MSEQDEPEHRFVVVGKNSVMRELDDKPEHPNLIPGAEMSVMSFLNAILRWMERRRAAKKRAENV